MKTKIFNICLCVAIANGLHAQNVGINDDSSSPDASAMLHVQSIDKGLLVPRMTTGQRTAISSPSLGLLIFDTDTESFWFNETGGWIQLVAGNTPDLYDSDNDTKVQTEESADEDMIRFDLGGSEKWIMENSTFYPNNSGFSLFIGGGAGANDDLSNNYNHFVGYMAGNATTNGANNVGFGREVLKANTLGFGNTAMGMAALEANTTGNFNLAVGYRPLFLNDIGDNNIALGKAALRNNTSGYYNIAMGDSTLYNHQTGFYNMALGNDALFNNTGNRNLAIGNGAARGNTTASYNLAIGLNSLYSNQTTDGNLAIGNAALYSSTALNPNTAVGDSALYSNTTGQLNMAIGTNSLYSNTVGNFNIAIGHEVLMSNDDGHGNIGVGILSLNNNLSGINNIGIGSNTLETNNDGNYNVAIGYNALKDNISGDFNIAIGNNSLQLSTGNNNTAVGRSAQATASTGIENTSLGSLSMYQITSGSSNTSVGYGAGANVFTSANSTYFGKFADQTSGAFQTNSMALGYNAKTTASNQVRIGSSAVTDIGGYASWTDLSDGRFKQNIRENVIGLDFILQLRPVTYQLNLNKLNRFLGIGENGERNEVLTGFIAQEVEESAKRLGYDFSGVVIPISNEQHYGLRYSQFVVPLVKAVQEQQALIEQLKNRLDLLERLLVSEANLEPITQQ